MKVIYGKENVSIQSCLGEISGSSFLHFVLAKKLIDTALLDSIKECQREENRIIYFSIKEEEDYLDIEEELEIT